MVIDLTTEFCGVERRHPIVGAAGPKFETPKQIEQAAPFFSEIVLKAGVSDAFPERKRWPHRNKAWPHRQAGYSHELQSRMYTQAEWLDFLAKSVEIGERYGTRISANWIAKFPIVEPGAVLDLSLPLDKMPHLVTEGIEDWIRFNEGINQIEGVARKEPDICPHASGGSFQDLVNMYVVLSKLILDQDSKFQSRTGRKPAVYNPKLLQINPLLLAQAVKKYTDVRGVVGVHRPMTLFLEQGQDGLYRPVNHSIPAPSGGDTYRGMNLLTLVNILGSTELEVDATGGVWTGNDAAEYLAIGARGVQVQTALMRYGYKRAERILTELTEIVERSPFNNLKDFIGHGRKHFGPQHYDPDFRAKLLVDPTDCTGCGSCVDFCMYSAITLNGKLPLVNADECQVCGNCVPLCPKGVYSLEPLK